MGAHPLLLCGCSNASAIFSHKQFPILRDIRASSLIFFRGTCRLQISNNFSSRIKIISSMDLIAISSRQLVLVSSLLISIRFCSTMIEVKFLQSYSILLLMVIFGIQFVHVNNYKQTSGSTYRFLVLLFAQSSLRC